MKKFLLLSIPIATSLLITACVDKNAEEGEEYPYGHYEDDKMIGDVREINKDEQIVEVDISEWEKRDRKGPGMTEEGYYYTAKITGETIFAYEDGTEASIDELKKGQKVLVNPPRGDSFEGEVNEIILLDMNFEEKYWMLLAPSDGLRIIVMYELGERLPPEMYEPLYEAVMDILEEKGLSASTGTRPYDKDYIVDFKEELDIEEFPVILVFDTDELLFKGYSLDELYTFLENLEK